MRIIQWQLYPSLGLKYHRSKYPGYNFDEILLIIGPLQVRIWT